MSLSDKRFEDYDYWSYKEKDVKEFINDIKSQFARELNLKDMETMNNFVNKLAGDELC